MTINSIISKTDNRNQDHQLSIYNHKEKEEKNRVIQEELYQIFRTENK